MKRMLSLLILSIFLLLSACAGVSEPFPTLPPVADLFGTPSPSPTPESPRVIAIFGAETSKDFLEGVASAAKEANEAIEIRPVKGGVSALSAFEPEGETAAIVVLSDSSEQLPKSTLPLYVFAADGQSVADGVAYLGYDNAEAAQIALEAALQYPPHLAPVRMLGLFSGQSSAAYTLWSDAKSAGKVFAKGEFIADNPDTVLTDWLNESFAAYYPGMLDAVFAETGALAVAAADALASLGRDDIEVFCAGTDSQALEKLSPILVCVVGANQREAGARCYTQTAKLLSGEPAQSGILLPEPLWFSGKEP